MVLLDFNLDISIIKSLFLLVLVISGNYVGELLGCKVRNILHNNVYVKHFTLFSLIYFTLGLVGDNKKHPYTVLKETIEIYILYIILSKTNYYVTGIILLLLFIMYNIDEYQEYMDENKKEYDKEKYDNIKDNITKLILMLLIFGFIYYLYDKKKEYKNKFKFKKFIFGNVECRNN